MTTLLSSFDLQILRIAKRGTTIHSLTKLLTQKLKQEDETITNTAVYHRIYRSIKKLLEENYLYIINPSSKPKVFAATQKALDLFVSDAKLKPRKITPTTPPIRARKQRQDTIKLLQTFKILNEDTLILIKQEFEFYIEDVSSRIIVLRKNPMLEYALPHLPEFMCLPYSTRFTDSKKKNEILNRYDAVWNAVSNKYKSAVHLVLTTDPKRFRNLWEANRHFSKAFNRFLSRLRKIFKERPLYICVFEFTASGLLHCHLIMFGRSYILPKRKITKIWEDCGQGTYNYVYALKNDNGRWVYKRERPKKCKKSETARDYLKKYLKKALLQGIGSELYWAFNKRFFSYSLRLKNWLTIRLPPSGIWIFYGSFPEWDIPLWLIQYLNNIEQIKLDYG